MADCYCTLETIRKKITGLQDAIRELAPLVKTILPDAQHIQLALQNEQRALHYINAGYDVSKMKPNSR